MRVRTEFASGEAQSWTQTVLRRPEYALSIAILRKLTQPYMVGINMNKVPRFVYKYLSAEAFKLVAQSHKLQWSLASAFNDPFDFQTEVQLGVPVSLAREYIATRLARLVLHPEEWQRDYPLWMRHVDLPSVFPFRNTKQGIWQNRPLAGGRGLKLTPQWDGCEHRQIAPSRGGRGLKPQPR